MNQDDVAFVAREPEDDRVTELRTMADHFESTAKLEEDSRRSLADRTMCATLRHCARMCRQRAKRIRQGGRK